MPQVKSNDEIWAGFNNRLLAAMQQNNWSEMREIYYEQAVFLHGEGHDSFKFLEESFKSELQQLRSEELEQIIERVEILFTEDSCPVCKSLLGNFYTISEALAQPPVPVAECDRASCRCSYAPVYEHN